MIPNKNINQLIERYLNNEMDPFEKELVDQLILKNEDIKKEVLLRKGIDKSLSKDDLFELRERLRNIFIDKKNSLKLEEPLSVYISWFNTAAIILLLLGIGSMTYLYFTWQNFIFKTNLTQVAEFNIIPNNDMFDVNPKDLFPTYTMSDSSLFEKFEKIEIKDRIKDKQKDLYAYNFTKSPYFESFIDNFRSSEIKVKSPLPECVFNQNEQIYFSWENQNNKRYRITLYNNRETILYRAYVDSSFTYYKKLEYGLYYWKLDNNNDQNYLNKFTIKEAN